MTAPLSLLLLSLSVMLPPVAAAASAEPELPELTAQLEGQHCRYQLDNEHSSTPRCTLAPKRAIGDWIWSRAAADERAFSCRCKGAAARCIGALKEKAQPAVPVLVRYLQQGQSDFDTGDGTYSCLSSVIEALGTVGDSRAVQPLIDYLSSPRQYDAAEGAIKGRVTGVAPAAVALGKLGPAAGSAVGILAAYMKRADEQALHAQTHVAEALGRLSLPDSAPALLPALRRFAEVFKQPVKRLDPLSAADLENRFETCLASLRALERLHDAGVSVEAALPEIRLVSTAAGEDGPPWIAHSLQGAPYGGPSVSQSLDDLRQIRGRAEALRLRAGDRRELDIIAMLYGICFPDEKLVAALGELSEQIESNLDNLVREAKDLRRGVPAGSKAVSGCRSQAAIATIKLLGRHGSENARRALRELAQVEELKRHAQKELAALEGTSFSRRD